MFYQQSQWNVCCVFFGVVMMAPWSRPSPWRAVATAQLPVLFLPQVFPTTKHIMYYTKSTYMCSAVLYLSPNTATTTVPLHQRNLMPIF